MNISYKIDRFLYDESICTKVVGKNFTIDKVLDSIKDCNSITQRDAHVVEESLKNDTDLSLKLDIFDGVFVHDRFHGLAMVVKSDDCLKLTDRKIVSVQVPDNKKLSDVIVG